MTDPCLALCRRCGLRPVADPEPPSFPFCRTCWPIVAVRNNYFVDEAGNFSRFMTEAEEAERAVQGWDDDAISAADLLAANDATDDDSFPF